MYVGVYGWNFLWRCGYYYMGNFGLAEYLLGFLWDVVGRLVDSVGGGVDLEVCRDLGKVFIFGKSN